MKEILYTFPGIANIEDKSLAEQKTLTLSLSLPPPPPNKKHIVLFLNKRSGFVLQNMHDVEINHCKLLVIYKLMYFTTAFTQYVNT